MSVPPLALICRWFTPLDVLFVLTLRFAGASCLIPGGFFHVGTPVGTQVGRQPRRVDGVEVLIASQARTTKLPRRRRRTPTRARTRSPRSCSSSSSSRRSSPSSPRASLCLSSARRTPRPRRRTATRTARRRRPRSRPRAALLRGASSPEPIHHSHPPARGGPRVGAVTALLRKSSPSMISHKLTSR